MMILSNLFNGLSPLIVLVFLGSWLMINVVECDRPDDSASCTRVTADSLSGYILALQWPVSFCHQQGECSLEKPRHDWIIHGLWPQNKPQQESDQFSGGSSVDVVQQQSRRSRYDELEEEQNEEEEDDDGGPELRASFRDFDEVDSGWESDDEDEDGDDLRNLRQNRRRRRRKKKFLQFCCNPQGFDPNKLESLTRQMNDIWPSLKRSQDQTEANLHFWNHEWTKHGTCARELSTSKPVPIEQYFQKVLELYGKFPIQQWLSQAEINPNNEQTYELTLVIDALGQGSGLGEKFSEMFQIKCANRKRGSGMLTEIRLCLDREFSLVSCRQLFGNGNGGRCTANHVFLLES